MAHQAQTPEPGPEPIVPASPPTWSGYLTWDRLLSLQIRAQSAALAAEVGGTGEYPIHGVSADADEILSTASGVLELAPRAERLVRDARTKHTALYGWPTVRARDAEGATTLQPLIVADLWWTRGRAQAVNRLPRLNPWLVQDRWFAPRAVDEAKRVFATFPPYRGEAALTAAARAVLRELGFADVDLGGLDAGALGREALGVPVENVALITIVPKGGSAMTVIDELEALRLRDDWRGTAAEWFVAPRVDVAERDGRSREPPSGPVLMPPDLGLNASQEDAVAAAIAPGRQLTVVAGPPGTGKSQVVAAIAANARVAGSSVLIASTNNTAVDAAVARANDGRDGLVLRTGARPARIALREAVQRLAKVEEVRGLRDDVRSRTLRVAREARDGVLDGLERRAQLHDDLAGAIADLTELRIIVRGDSSAPDDATIETAIRAAAGHASWGARRTRKRLLRDTRRVRPELTDEDIDAWAAAERRARELRRGLDELPPYDPDADRRALRAADEGWQRASGEAVVAAVRRSLVAGRAELLQLHELRRDGLEAYRAAVGRLRAKVPGWATNCHTASASFPLQPAIFDVLVLDEASTCEIAVVLPLAYRAKRLVVVGDTNQLAPVVTLDAEDIARVTADAGTTVSETERLAVSIAGDSAYTAIEARAPDPPILLAEHYRCHPQIAEYINRTFYGGRLRVLTPVGGTHPLRGLRWIESPGACVPDRRGRTTNPGQADAVVAWVLEHRDAVGSIGVLTPFRAQADLIEALLAEKLGPDAASVKVGTAHALQGDERDVIAFSTVIGSGASRGAVTFLKNESRVINVAVSRGRHAVVAFGQREALEHHGVDALVALADVAEGRRTATAHRADAAVGGAELHSDAERRLYVALRDAGLEVVAKPIVEGYELDFHVHAGDPSVRLDVECDGPQHQEHGRGRRRRGDLVRDARLEAVGWTVLRLPDWRCLHEPEDAADEVRAVVERMRH